MKAKSLLVALLALFSLCVAARVPAKKASAYDQGVKAFESRHYAQAADYFESALEVNPENGYAEGYLGACRRMLEQYGEAIDLLAWAQGKVESKDPTFAAWIAYERFLCRMEQRDSVFALKDVDDAIRLNDGVSEYYESRAFLRYGLHDKKGAADDIVRALRLNTDGDIDRAKTLVHVLGAYEHDYISSLLNKQAVANRDRADFWISLDDNLARSGESFETITIEERDVVDSDEVELPEFKGGSRAMRAYLDEKTGYDHSAAPLKAKVEITVDEVGSVVDARLEHSCGRADLDKKAVEICKGMPQFLPALHDGEERRCRMVLTLRFLDKKK